MNGLLVRCQLMLENQCCVGVVDTVA